MPTTPFLEFDFSLTEQDLRACEEYELRRARLEPFFAESFRTVINLLAAKRVFLSHASFVATGKCLTAGPLQSDASQQIIDYLTMVSDGVGYRPIHSQAPEANLKSSPGVPADIYSTAYATRLFAICDAHLPNPEQTARWILSLHQPSGWFVDSTWADTEDRYKFHQELAMQMLQALFLIGFQNAVPLEQDSRDKARRAVLGLFQQTWYMGTLADLVQALMRLNHAFENDHYVRMSDFLQTHFDPNTGGFFEYRFEKAKFSTQTGAMQRYNHDYLVPSIPASYAALRVLLWLRQMGRQIDGNLLDGSARFFSRLESNDGFGTRVQIAKYAAPVGPLVSPLESLMVLFAPALLRKIRSLR